MTFLLMRIRALAYLGKTPREIERTLGIFPNTLLNHHRREFFEGREKRKITGANQFSTEETRLGLFGIYQECKQISNRFRMNCVHTAIQKLAND